MHLTHKLGAEPSPIYTSNWGVFAPSVVKQVINSTLVNYHLTIIERHYSNLYPYLDK
jgi:hypothetical protein